MQRQVEHHACCRLECVCSRLPAWAAQRDTRARPGNGRIHCSHWWSRLVEFLDCSHESLVARAAPSFKGPPHVCHACLSPSIVCFDRPLTDEEQRLPAWHLLAVGGPRSHFIRLRSRSPGSAGWLRYQPTAEQACALFARRALRDFGYFEPLDDGEELRRAQLLAAQLQSGSAAASDGEHVGAALLASLRRGFEEERRRHVRKLCAELQRGYQRVLERRRRAGEPTSRLRPADLSEPDIREIVAAFLRTVHDLHVSPSGDDWQGSKIAADALTLLLKLCDLAPADMVCAPPFRRADGGST